MTIIGNSNKSKFVNSKTYILGSGMVDGGDYFVGGDLGMGDEDIWLDAEEDNECGEDDGGDAFVVGDFG